MPQRLEIEITETALLVDGPTMRLVLQTLRDAGIAIALDDFGTGYSSLSHIRNYPIGKIKIDQSFVREFGAVRDSTAIVLAVLGLAADLGMTTTAEGIETEEQRSRLRFAGCELAQGYFFGRPQPNAEFRRLLGRHAPTLEDQVRRA
jgi:EAL domain-containing protein (putative c-di-GMP-specific phosphodiesterase class I)